MSKFKNIKENSKWADYILFQKYFNFETYVSYEQTFKIKLFIFVMI